MEHPSRNSKNGKKIAKAKRSLVSTKKDDELSFDEYMERLEEYQAVFGPISNLPLKHAAYKNVKL